jgi:hypothetical protein
MGFFFPASEKAASLFVGSRNDPMFRLQRHIRSITRRLLRQPLVIFIDDLDRCDADFVVRLLEGMQTLFRDARVTFVVAADRTWLNQAYEIVYQQFANVSTDKTRPLGLLFLEKTFQMSVAVPQISPAVRTAYWRSLLHKDAPGGEAGEVSAAIEENIRTLGTEGEVVDYVRDQAPELRPMAARAAILRLAAPDMERDILRHRLEKFADLLEPNPRAMKRLAMAYGMNQATDILLGNYTDPDKLALWTIASMRWPLLVDWLAEHPQDITWISSGESLSRGRDKSPPELVGLFSDPEVRQVFLGLDASGETIVEEGLDTRTFSTLSRLASSQ